ncbi:unnamed protein product, partial [Tetraodon nigroviridis]
ALHEVLERLQTKRINPWEKKYGQVPSVSPPTHTPNTCTLPVVNHTCGTFQCDLGEHCAIRKGSRIGKMCDCPRGALCNIILLKCL